ncbi:hypothetical protein GQ53DRAFT_319967 [Thozetella sp. PMI_491]|nr:hypothetical protein GQ53DRAFT_319967 [Thozetella sp. PMI_491]
MAQAPPLSPNMTYSAMYAQPACLLLVRAAFTTYTWYESKRLPTTQPPWSSTTLALSSRLQPYGMREGDDTSRRATSTHVARLMAIKPSCIMPLRMSHMLVKPDDARGNDTRLVGSSRFWEKSPPILH